MNINILFLKNLKLKKNLSRLLVILLINTLKYISALVKRFKIAITKGILIKIPRRILDIFFFFSLVILVFSLIIFKLVSKLLGNNFINHLMNDADI